MSTTTQRASEAIPNAIIRFAGDSGDGMQLSGSQFTDTCATGGNDVVTFPDFPAEIRAPAGTPAGVSGFQINFSSELISSHGDAPDALIAMNPAALKSNIADLKKGGLLIINSDAWSPIDLRKAGYDSDPLADDGVLIGAYQVIKVPMTSLVDKALADLEMKQQHKRRCKNFIALGLCYWIYSKELSHTEKWLQAKFGKKPEILEANIRALRAGYNYGDTCELLHARFEIGAATMPPGTYRQITGNTALALGLVSAAHRRDMQLVYGTYPITPASDILHELSRLKNFNVKTVQAEDEISAIGIALGASYAGALGVTASAGPGLCLKAEFIGLATAVELPLVILDVQRGGPSTGLPTKTEQSDLLMAIFGRHGESPTPVLAAATPGDCFDVSQEAARIAIEFMSPVIVLSDGFIANSSDLWRVPEPKDLAPIPHAKYSGPKEGYQPYGRDSVTLARKWVVPGTPDIHSTLTGLEKNHQGHISYDGRNHDRMSRERQAKVERIADSLPPTQIHGAASGKVLVLSWGGTFGSVYAACSKLQQQGESVSLVHLRYLNPLPKDLGDILSKFEKIVIPELNLGQLSQIIRARFVIAAHSITKMEGKPFFVDELVSHIKTHLA